jgi:glucose/arabinose dehydrogenase
MMPYLLLVKNNIRDLPALPGPSHNECAITIGPDNNFYIPIGNTDKMEDETEAQNEPDFPEQVAFWV